MNYRIWTRVFGAALLVFAAGTAFSAPAVGDVPPELVGRDAGGKKVLLTDYRGKAIVLSFWATWCHYCMKELPILYNIQKAAGKERLQVIAVNTETREVFRKVARSLKNLDLQLASDEDKDAQDAYGVNGIPHMVIIGRDGRIVSIHRGYDESQLSEIAADINEALAVPEPSSQQGL